MRALMLSVFLAGCAAPVQTVVQAQEACSREIFIPTPHVEIAMDEEDSHPRPRSRSLGYIGDEPLTGGSRGGGSSWHEYMRRGSWGTASRSGISFGSYPNYNWSVSPSSYGYHGRR